MNVKDRTSLRALELIFGEPNSAIDDSGALSYRWKCGCSAHSADGRYYAEVTWCSRHHGLIDFETPVPRKRVF